MTVARIKRLLLLKTKLKSGLSDVWRVLGCCKLCYLLLLEGTEREGNPYTLYLHGAEMYKFRDPLLK